MENASKALIMAAGVLIGVLILSLAVYLFTSFGSTSAQINEQNAQKQVEQFNMKFTSYLKKEGLTIYDVITVAGYANENNKYYEDNDENKVTVYLVKGNVSTEETILKNKKSLINSDKSMINEQHPNLPTYECYGDEYNSKGRIKKIYFKINS